MTKRGSHDITAAQSSDGSSLWPLCFCVVCIVLSLIGMLQPLQSCQNLVTVQAHTSYCLTASIGIGPLPAAMCTVIWSGSLLLPRISSQTSYNPVAVCLIRALFLALVFTHTALGDLLPSSRCIILSALGCERREREAIHLPWDGFIPLFCFPLSVIKLSHDGKHHCVLSEGETQSFFHEQRLSLPQPHDNSESAGSLFLPPSFAYLHSSPSLPLAFCLLWTNPLTLTDETHHVVVWLWSGAGIPIVPLFFLFFFFCSPQKSRIYISGKVGSCEEREHFFSGCCGNTSLQLFCCSLPKNQASSYCFLLAT